MSFSPKEAPSWAIGLLPYPSPQQSSIYETSLSAAEHSSSQFWLSPGSRKRGHCTAGFHRPPASLFACSCQAGIIQHCQSSLHTSQIYLVSQRQGLMFPHRTGKSVWRLQNCRLTDIQDATQMLCNHRKGGYRAVVMHSRLSSSNPIDSGAI